MRQINAKQWNSYAEKYHDFVISPFQGGVRNPVYRIIKKIRNRGVAADLGTGPGDFLGFLSEEFDRVYAVDFSERMLEVARRNNCSRKNIEYRKGDIRKLSLLGIKPDVILAINSILHPSQKDIKKAFREICCALRAGGTFIGIFPSMEAIVHYVRLVYESELARLKDESKAAASSKRIAETSKYDFVKGIYDDGEKQKLFYEFELNNLLAEAGFGKIRFDRVFYPWKLNGDFRRFDGKPEMWDWLAVCHKSEKYLK